MKAIRHLTAFFIFAILSTPLFAESQSYISLQATNDNADGKDFYIGSSVDFIKSSKLKLSIGKSDTPEADTRNYSIGISTDPLADFSLGLTYLYWEQKNEIKIHTTQLDLNKNTRDWAFGLIPQLATITIYPLSAPAFDTNRTGLGLSAAYYGAKPLFVSAAMYTYSYDRRVSTLNVNQNPWFTMRNFSMNTLDQTAGLEDYRFSFDIGYNFSGFTLGLYHERSQSAVDDSTTTSNSIYGDFNLSDDWLLGMELGRTENSLTADETITFTSFSITYYW